MSRFNCPSGMLVLGALLSRSWRSLWVGLACAAAAHVSLTWWVSPREGQRPVKPLTTQFIKRAPRLTKPLELKKHPRPKPRMMRRRTVAVKARADRQQIASGVRPVEVLASVAKPRGDVGRWVTYGVMPSEPQSRAQQILGSKESKGTLDMSLEMMDVVALDTGQYQAMVIQDPGDKKNIKGFFHLAIVYSVSMRKRSFHSDDSRTTRALRTLVGAMNLYTQIKTDMRSTYTFASRAFYETPWVYSSARFAFKITQSEARNLGRYLLGGGFFVTDFIPHGAEQRMGHWLQIDVSNRRMFKDALATQNLLHGRDWDFQKLPNSHPIYHCFFDFPQGPPVCGDHLFIRGGWSPFDYLEGIIINHRLLGLVCRKFFTNPWGDWAGGYMGLTDGSRQLQFGVNMIVYALTGEGSITNRLMDSVSR